MLLLLKLLAMATEEKLCLKISLFLTGGTVISERTWAVSLKMLHLTMLGRARSVKVDIKKTTIIVDGAGDKD